MDKFPLKYKRMYQEEEKKRNPWVISNACRIASQILVGLEVLELISIVEGIVAKQVPWIPFSYHHDGFAFIAKPDSIDPCKKILEDYLANRLKGIGLRPIKLEISNYQKINDHNFDLLEKTVLSEDEWATGTYKKKENPRKRKKAQSKPGI